MVRGAESNPVRTERANILDRTWLPAPEAPILLEANVRLGFDGEWGRHASCYGSPGQCYKRF